MWWLIRTSGCRSTRRRSSIYTRAKNVTRCPLTSSQLPIRHIGACCKVLSIFAHTLFCFNYYYEFVFSLTVAPSFFDCYETYTRPRPYTVSRWSFFTSSAFSSASPLLLRILRLDWLCYHSWSSSCDASDYARFESAYYYYYYYYLFELPILWLYKAVHDCCVQGATAMKRGISVKFLSTYGKLGPAQTGCPERYTRRTSSDKFLVSGSSSFRKLKNWPTQRVRLSYFGICLHVKSIYVFILSSISNVDGCVDGCVCV